MTYDPFIISLPIADRVRSHAFYQEALGLEPLGEPADDGIPEPLMFALNDRTRLMLVPTGGFGWVVGDNEVAGPGVSECLLGISAADEGHVDAIVERARAAGAVVAGDPAPMPWGYAATFSDPDGHRWMVNSAPIPG